jgi:hypothetical protein
LAPPAASIIAGGENPRFAPTDKPMIVRGFMPGTAGMRGIAVGTPAGMHFAFDSERCALAAVWTGDFAEIGGWYDNGRGKPEENGLKPLGTIVWRTMADASFREAPQAAGSNIREIHPQFRSIATDADGAKVTFVLPREDGSSISVEESWKPSGKDGFERTLAISGGPTDGLQFVFGAAPVLHARGDVYLFRDGDRAWTIEAVGGKFWALPTQYGGTLRNLLILQPSERQPAQQQSLRVIYRFVKPSELDEIK